MIKLICLFAAVVGLFASQSADFNSSGTCESRIGDKSAIILYTGPFKSPYLPELLALPSLNPDLVSDENVLMLNLSDVQDAACSHAITRVNNGSLLVFWEDGNLSSSWASFPQLESKQDGGVAVFGKTGRAQAGLTTLSLLSSIVSIGGDLFVYDMDALVDLRGLEKLQSIGETECFL